DVPSMRKRGLRACGGRPLQKREQRMDVKTIAVIGAGTMGRGIGYAAAFGSYKTVLEDVSRHVLEQGVAWIRQSFEEGVARGKVEVRVRDKALSLISTASNVEDAIRDADLIIEAVPEELEMKLELFTILDKFATTGAIFASNTSSLSITGFINTRVNALIGNEAFNMLEAGIATPEDIDKALKLGLNHPMGPFELVDLVGLDVRLKILEYLHETLGEKYRPNSLLRRYVQEGRLGRKTGRGVYDYTQQK